MSRNYIKLLLFILLIVAAPCVFATKPPETVKLNLRVLSQDVNKKEVTVLGTIILTQASSKFKSLKASIDVPVWGLRKISGIDKKEWLAPRLGKAYNLKAKYKIVSEDYKIIPVSLSVFGKIGKIWIPLVASYSDRYLTTGGNNHLFLKVQQQKEPVCVLKEMPTSQRATVISAGCTHIKSATDDAKSWVAPDGKRFTDEGKCKAYTLPLEQQQARKEREKEIEELRRIPCDFIIPQVNSAKEVPKSDKDQNLLALIDLPEFGYSVQIPVDWTIFKIAGFALIGPRLKDDPRFILSEEVQLSKWCFPSSFDINTQGSPLDAVARFLFGESYTKSVVAYPKLDPFKESIIYTPVLYSSTASSVIGKTVLFARLRSTGDYEVFQFSISNPVADQKTEKIFFDILKSLKLHKADEETCSI